MTIIKKRQFPGLGNLSLKGWAYPKIKSIFQSLKTDDEAYQIWHEKMGVPENQIARLGAKDNFWAAGETGPCGPCSELYFDLGESMGDKPFKEDVLSDGNRYLEFYNLVFMEFNRQSDGSLVPLPAKNIDTGMGFRENYFYYSRQKDKL